MPRRSFYLCIIHIFSPSFPDPALIQPHHKGADGNKAEKDKDEDQFLVSFTTTSQPEGSGEKDKKKKKQEEVEVKITDMADMKTRLPEFLMEPQDAYIIREKSANLRCSVSGASKAYFVCNGEAMAESPLQRELLASYEPTKGAEIRELHLEVTRDLVEEFFGKFTCRCDAWSKVGRVSSRDVLVETACKSVCTPQYSYTTCVQRLSHLFFL